MAISPSKPSRKLSTLEQTVLGLVWLRGPCTTYTIMRDLASSESTYHRSRASTVYSISKRLLRFGLLEHSGEGEGWVQTTSTGRTALLGWLEPPIPMADVAHTADLLRLRFFFLGALLPEARLRFIDEAIASLEDLLGRSEELIEENEKIGEFFGALATVSMVLETRSRIEWLRLAREWVNREVVPGYGAALVKAARSVPPTHGRSEKTGNSSVTYRRDSR